MRELELLMGLHGSFFYVTMQRWIYGQTIYITDAPPPPLAYSDQLVRDRVRSYLLSSAALFSPGEASPVPSRRLTKGRSSSRRSKETS
jgi:hypothetical protein